MKKPLTIFFVGAPLFALLLVALRVYYSAVVWRYQGPDADFVIAPNESFSSINTRLTKEHLISSARLFHRYSQLKGVLNKFRTGHYIIRHNSNLLDVFNIFINEKSQVVLFTVPEGKNMYEIGRMLEASSITNYKDFIQLARDKKFLEELGIDADSVEGYLYPESYDFVPNLPARTVIKTMVKQFQKKIATVDFSNSRMTPRQVLILASMVEKETGDKKERPIIAGVFYNRLKLKMRLQSDPTTIYGKFEVYNGNLSRKDLLTPTAYNTYTIPALPVGPISNPGIESIKAVLNPTLHKYLYFVSQNDGSHIFSESYEKHEEAVTRWQKNPKNREGRSWRDHEDSN
ncbi:MAG: endolytic transglycosylase MltG [Bacteriovorax sp.]|nr:endolytic transglycosylase MltG [Bacteriovorax sp.]